MLDKTRAERLIKKYGSATAKTSSRKEMSLMNRPGPGRGMQQGGKPKNTKKAIARLLSYIGSERWLIVLSLIFSLTFTVTSLATSYMLRPIMNKFIYYDASNSDFSQRLEGLLSGLIFMAVLYALSIITQWGQQRIMLSVSQKTLKKMRGELFSKLQRLPVRYFDTHPTGDVMSRFTNDVDTVGEMLNTTLIQIISGAITIVGTLILMMITSPLLGLITLLMTPFLTWVSKVIISRGRGAYSKQQKALGMVNGYAEEMISGQKVTKIFNRENMTREEFEHLNNALCEAQMKAQFRAGIMGPVTHQLCNLTYAVTAAVGAYMIAFHSFDVGGLTVALDFTRKFNRPINEISMQMNTVFSALAGAERVFEVLDCEEEAEKGNLVEPFEIKGRVEFKNVDFGYTPEKQILYGINLVACPGQKIAFVGSTGAGKTTVTSLLTRFYDITSGEITVDGISIDRMPREFLRRNVAMVLQDTHLFTGTVRENIRYGRLDATDEEVEAAARASSAHSFIMQLENGYDTVLENDGANLSQGQRQLLNIARAAISKAPILVLDEATSSVDTRTERMIEEGMDALMENRTTFVIAHRLSTVRKSDRIMVLEKGRVIEEGTHSSLLEMNGRYADLYHEIEELD